MDRSSLILRRHTDPPVSGRPGKSAVREPPGFTKLFIFTYPTLSTIILLIGFVLIALVSA